MGWNVLFSYVMGRDELLGIEGKAREDLLARLAPRLAHGGVNVFVQRFDPVRNSPWKITRTRLSKCAPGSATTDSVVATDSGDPGKAECYQQFIRWSRTISAGASEVLWILSHGNPTTIKPVGPHVGVGPMLTIGGTIDPADIIEKLAANRDVNMSGILERIDPSAARSISRHMLLDPALKALVPPNFRQATRRTTGGPLGLQLFDTTINIMEFNKLCPPERPLEVLFLEACGLGSVDCIASASTCAKVVVCCASVLPESLQSVDHGSWLTKLGGATHTDDLGRSIAKTEVDAAAHLSDSDREKLQGPVDCMAVCTQKFQQASLDLRALIDKSINPRDPLFQIRQSIRVSDGDKAPIVTFLEDWTRSESARSGPGSPRARALKTLASTFRKSTIYHAYASPSHSRDYGPTVATKAASLSIPDKAPFYSATQWMTLFDPHT